MLGIACGLIGELPTGEISHEFPPGFYTALKEPYPQPSSSVHPLCGKLPNTLIYHVLIALPMWITPLLEATIASVFAQRFQSGDVRVRGTLAAVRGTPAR